VKAEILNSEKIKIIPENQHEAVLLNYFLGTNPSPELWVSLMYAYKPDEGFSGEATLTKKEEPNGQIQG